MFAKMFSKKPVDETTASIRDRLDTDMSEGKRKEYLQGLMSENGMVEKLDYVLKDWKDDLGRQLDSIQRKAFCVGNDDQKTTLKEMIAHHKASFPRLQATVEMTMALCVTAKVSTLGAAN